MLAVRIFIIISLIFIYIVSCVSTIDNTIPEISSDFISDTGLLPERSDSTRTQFPFQDYIPIACFCDWSKCNAKVPSIEAPIIGLFTRDGKIVKSLVVEVHRGELMYILLIDGNSSLVDGTHLNRTSYWHLTDGQHQLLAGTSFDLEIRQQVLVSILNEKSLQFSYGTETKHTAITALEMSTGLSISVPEVLESKIIYHYSASPLSQLVGIYQLFHELTIDPGVSLKNYVENQKTGARCSLYIVLRGTCGSLQLLPSFLQRTSVFRRIAVVTTTTGSPQTSEKTDPSGKAKTAIISLSIVGILLAVFAFAFWYYHGRHRWGKLPVIPAHVLLENDE